MVSHSSILAWKIPLTEEYGRLYSPWGHKRVGHDLAITQQFSHIILEFACLEVLSSNLNWELQLNSDTNHLELMSDSTVFLPGESHGQRNLVGYSHGVAKSRT